LDAWCADRPVEDTEPILNASQVNGVRFFFHLQQQPVGDVVLANGRCLAANTPPDLVVIEPLVLNKMSDELSFFRRTPLFDPCDMPKTEIRLDRASIGHFDIGDRSELIELLERRSFDVFIPFRGVFHSKARPL
jgi:hypothetical protein